MAYDGEHPGVGKPCSVCKEPYKPLRGGMCRKHYRRTRSNGHPDLTRALGVSDEDRLRINGWTVSDSGCWEWSGNLGRDGYGKVTRANKTVRAHRLAYETWVGPIPEGHVVIHSCDNPPCINPEHLRPGTHQENTHDMLAKGRGRWQKGTA